MIRLTLLMTVLSLTASSMAMAQTDETKADVLKKFNEKYNAKQSKCDKEQLENFKKCTTEALAIFSKGPFPKTEMCEDNPKEEALYKAFRKCVCLYCPRAAAN